ncbi:MAG: class D sortase [Clostridia bacterium]|jgi:sortase A|nr:class D sortase [Clostridia bacterium]
MKTYKKFKFQARFKEVIILIIFIAVTSFAIIEVKDLLNQEKVKSLTEELQLNGGSTNNNIIAKLKGEDIPLRVTGNAIAVLDIPAYSIRGQIVEGTDDETLKNYVGKFIGSAEPGQIGNFSLAAHNNIYTELFRNLHKVQIGDKIRIVTKTHEYIYTVTSTQTVDPTRTDVLEGSNKREITLITCTQAATKRIVVKGELTSERELNDQEKEEGVK